MREERNTKHMPNESSVNTFGDDIEDFADKEARLKAEAALKPANTVVDIKVAKKPPESSGPRVKVDKNKLHQAVGKLNIHTSKDPKSKKVKFHSLAVYIITELALKDEEYQNICFEIEAQEALHDDADNVVEGLENRLLEINGAVDELLTMGRWFGVPKTFMLQYIPNINADEMERNSGVDQTIARAMKA